MDRPTSQLLLLAVVGSNTVPTDRYYSRPTRNGAYGGAILSLDWQTDIDLQTTLQSVLQALEIIKDLNETNRRNVPTTAPIDFVKPRWSKHVFKGETIDRHYYEMCALAELRSRLRSGDIWVVGSQQFQDFEDYLLPPLSIIYVRYG